jgi:hypothetical protein
MRFMMLVKASQESEAGVLPSAELIEKMGQYNEQLVKAGVLLAAEGLQASSKGARVTFSAAKPTVTDGPFAETKELLAGYWLIEVKSKDEAIAWATRIPFADGEVVEVRQVFDPTDFADVASPEVIAREQELRAAVQRKSATS